MLGLRKELVLRDVPADRFLVLFSEAAGIHGVSEPDLLLVSPTLRVPVCVCGCLGSGTRNWKGLNRLRSQ